MSDEVEPNIPTRKPLPPNPPGATNPPDTVHDPAIHVPRVAVRPDEDAAADEPSNDPG